MTNTSLAVEGDSPNATLLKLPAVEHGRFAPLDGVRGMAILAVLLLHNLMLAENIRVDHIIGRICFQGWVGVDLFFVLSGYLITGILWDAKSEPHYFRNFYMRRVLRIFPLYYLLITLTFFAFPYIHSAILQFLIKDSGHSIWYYLFLNNLYRGGAKGGAMLDVAWSLAIEEQFYFLWPTVVLLFARRQLMKICGLLIVGALLVRFLFWRHGALWDTIYTFTFSRFDGLAIGAWIALAFRGPHPRQTIIRAAWIATGFAVIWVLTVGGMERLSLWKPGLGMVFRYTPVDLVCGAILVAALTSVPGNVRYRLFAAAPLQFVGRISYAMYLLHIPVLFLVCYHFRIQDRIPRVFNSQLPMQFIFYVVTIGTTTLIAWLSWHLYEKHFLRLKRYFPAHLKVSRSDT